MHKWLKVFFSAWCEENYYGWTCDAYCKEDASIGQYTCDPKTGTKKCKAGWKGSNCHERALNLMCLIIIWVEASIIVNEAFCKKYYKNQQEHCLCLILLTVETALSKVSPMCKREHLSKKIAIFNREYPVLNALHLKCI